MAAREKVQGRRAIPRSAELEYLFEKLDVSQDLRNFIVGAPFVIAHGEYSSQNREGLQHVFMLVANDVVLAWSHSVLLMVLVWAIDRWVFLVPSPIFHDITSVFPFLDCFGARKKPAIFRLRAKAR
jgi:hypothetical protein